VQIIAITSDEFDRLLEINESHFVDFKSKRIAPAKITRSVSAFGNADGGELFVGIEEDDDGSTRWDGFDKLEDANGLVQAVENCSTAANDIRMDFFQSDRGSGVVLRVEISKSQSIITASDGKPYLRKGAQNLPQVAPEQVRRLELNKGITSFEDQTVRDDVDAVVNSMAVIEFMLNVIPHNEPEAWLKKQRLIRDALPTVAAEILFGDEPQTVLPKSTIKVYRYKTSGAEGTRETLDFQPITVEGNAYSLIRSAVAETVRITEQSQVLGHSGLEQIHYPTEAIHEVITNAVLHRDYSLNDDVHVRIFDNRIEVESPGTLPAHVTERNILKERFARNPKIVRIINKFPDPPNKDVGEGLNTAFEAMRNLRLKEPLIQQRENSVLVVLRHERLAGTEETIMEYLSKNDEINNSKAREICHEGSENKMKRTFERMMESQLIERIPERRGKATAYRVVKKDESK
jgi:ATP-dependent DNA helicase RecG